MLSYQQKYLKYKKKYLELKQSINNFNMSGGGNDKTLTLIKAEWCGHCQSFKPTWEELPSKIENINFKLLDSEKDKKIIEEKYDVKGFPTLILEKDGKQIEYEDKRTIEAIKEFVENN